MSSSLPNYSLLHGRPSVRSSMSTAFPASALPNSLPSAPSYLCSPSPSSSTEGASPIDHYQPFNFGAEFEILVRPKDLSLLAPALHLPDFDASHREKRSFSLALLPIISELLTDSGLPCNVYVPDDEDEGHKPDYTKWNSMLDGSLSKKHQVDGFYPVEIVTPVVVADATWIPTIDKFWSVVNLHFEFRCDTSCGFHVHISPSSGEYDVRQLRRIAKAVVLWERNTAQCAPPSRQDKVMAFCKSNIKGDVPAGRQLQTHGSSRGLRRVFRYIDLQYSHDAIVDYVCPDKYRAWNFLPAKEGGHGSFEFHRAPGVFNAKKAKHWIAFTMAFVDMAMRLSLDSIVRRLAKQKHRSEAPSQTTFDDFLLASAERIGVWSQLDPRLHQLDEPRTLHITTMLPDHLEWLRRFDDDYRESVNS